MLLLCDERAAGALRSPDMLSRSSPLMPVRTCMVGRSAQPLAGHLRVTGGCRAGAAGRGRAVLWPGLHGKQMPQCSLQSLSNADPYRGAMHLAIPSS